MKHSSNSLFCVVVYISTGFSGICADFIGVVVALTKGCAREAARRAFVILCSRASKIDLRESTRTYKESTAGIRFLRSAR